MNYIYINHIKKNIYHINNNFKIQIKDSKTLFEFLKNTPIIFIKTIYKDSNNNKLNILTKLKTSNSKIRDFFKNQELAEIINNYDIWCEKGLSIDFNSSKTYLRCKNLSKSDLLIKACGKKILDKKPEHIIDATAGLGTDSFILSYAFKNTEISLIEENKIISLLLKNGIKNGLENSSYPDTQKTCEQMQLYNGNAINIIPELKPADIIYLDPMFAENSFKGAVKKPMQLMHNICPAPSLDNINNLLETSLKHAKNRVIVKRAKAAPIISPNNNIKPNYQISGKAIRYDIYLTK